MSRERARALEYHMHHIWSTVREQSTAAQTILERNANRHRVMGEMNSTVY